MQKSIYTDEYAVFARRLREARHTAGLKQTELAARLGKPHSYVSRIETRQIRVDVIELREICAALGISFRGFVNALEDELDGAGPGTPETERTPDRTAQPAPSAQTP